MITLYQAFKAALQIAPKKDVRYFLNGVHVVKNDGVVTITSTDGHRLFRTRDVDASLVTDDTMDVIIDRNSVEMMLKLGKHFTIGDGEAKDFEGNSLKYAVVDGKFPDVDRVIPHDGADLYDGGICAFGSDLMMGIIKSCSAITGRTKNNGMIMEHIMNGDGGLGQMKIKLEGFNDTLWILMPRRIG